MWLLKPTCWEQMTHQHSHGLMGLSHNLEYVMRPSSQHHTAQSTMMALRRCVAKACSTYIPLARGVHALLKRPGLPRACHASYDSLHASPCSSEVLTTPAYHACGSANPFRARLFKAVLRKHTVWALHTHTCATDLHASNTCYPNNLCFTLCRLWMHCLN